MTEIRDYRIRMDLTFPPAAAQYIDQIRDALLPLYQNALNIHNGDPNAEISYIEIERCGHRLEPPQPCEVIARWEVGRGRVI